MTVEISSAIQDIIFEKINKVFYSLVGDEINQINRDNVPEFSDFDIVSEVQIVSEDDTYHGVFYCKFSKDAIFYILEKIYGKEFTSIDDTVRAGVGEITNMVYAQVKSVLNQKLGSDFKLVVPKVLEEPIELDDKNSDIYFNVNSKVFSITIALNKV